MAIRLRTVNGYRVALCACETDAAPDDVYLDDSDHYALAAKFAQDWWDHPNVSYPEQWAVMRSQKMRDARDVHRRLQERLDRERSKSQRTPEPDQDSPAAGEG